MGDVVTVLHPAYLSHGRVRGLPGLWTGLWAEAPARIPEADPRDMPFHAEVAEFPAGHATPTGRSDALHLHGGRLWARLGSPGAWATPAGLGAWLATRASGQGAAVDRALARSFRETPLGEVPGHILQARAPALGRALREDGRDRCAANAAAFAEGRLRVAGDGAYLRLPGPVACLMTEPRTEGCGHRMWLRLAYEFAPEPSRHAWYGRLDRQDLMHEALGWQGRGDEACLEPRRLPKWLQGLPEGVLETDDDVDFLVRDLPWRTAADLLALRRAPQRPSDPDRLRAREAELEALAPRALTRSVLPEEREAALETVVDLVDALGTWPGCRGARSRLADLADWISRYALPRLRETPPPAPEDEAAMAGLGPG